MNMNGLIKPILLGAMALLLAGCDEEKYTLRFSHDLHVNENGMDCSDCHGDAAEGFTPLSHDSCSDCHDEAEETEIRANTCGLCHAGKLDDLAKGRTAKAEKPKRTVFVHTEALAGNCQDCHGAIMEKGLEKVPMLRRADVIGIREAAHVSGRDCQACHVDMDRSEAPSSHDQVWMKRHGMLGSQADASCSVCHSENSCLECHSVMQPASHNNLWRMRSHGAAAAWNRDGCMVCHQQDSCQSCHAETPPRSHNARWAASGKRPTHCIGCHTAGSAGEGCVVCHEDGNNLLLHAGFWPAGPGAQPDHDKLGTAVSCYECHWTTTP